MDTGVNLVKQPKPEVVSSNEPGANNKPKRKIIRPHVGVISLPKISNTPISDTLQLKEKENPQTKYKITPTKKARLTLKELASLTIGACGLIALFTFKKKK